MKKIVFIILFVTSIFTIFLFLKVRSIEALAPLTCTNSNPYAYSCQQPPNCTLLILDYEPADPNSWVDISTARSLHYRIVVRDNNSKYRVRDETSWTSYDYGREFPVGTTSLEDTTTTWNANDQDIRKAGPHSLFIEAWSPTQNNWINYCGPIQYNIVSPPTNTPAPTLAPTYNCDYTITSSNTDNTLITPFDTVSVAGNITKMSGGTLPAITKLNGNAKLINYRPPPRGGGRVAYPMPTRTPTLQVTSSGGTINFTGAIGNLFDYGEYEISITEDEGYSSKATSCPKKHFIVSESGTQPSTTPSPFPTPTDDPVCNTSSCGTYQSGPICSNPVCENCHYCRPTITPIASPPPIPSLAPLCDQLPNNPTNNFRGKCWDCQNSGKLWTAIGCVPTDLATFVKDYVFGVGLGIAGGIAFLYFLYGVFLITTSAGVAEKVAEGKEIIVSALSGLLLIIFSIFLLRIIGVDILKLPGFS